MAKYLIKIIKNKCINCGVCAKMLPELFELSHNGYAIIRKEYRINLNNELVGVISEELLKKVKLVANKCLGSAIEIERST